MWIIIIYLMLNLTMTLDIPNLFITVMALGLDRGIYQDNIETMTYTADIK
jgi:hypothetical protein